MPVMIIQTSLTFFSANAHTIEIPIINAIKYQEAGKV